ncbi:MAG TPA: hypothetical protein VLM40_01555 [Gemmata sp.]|nr:hypothetical protein [Gemmata sp.]
MTHPFLALLREALNLMHPRFAAAYGVAYTAEEAEEPPAARKAKERSFLMEFYAEFRRLWDRAEPVRRGLGHVIVRGEPESPNRQPDLLFWQLGERGEPDRRLAAVSLVFSSNPLALAADLKLLARFRDLGYPLSACVLIGVAADAEAPATDGVQLVRFDTEKWQVVE